MRMVTGDNKTTAMAIARECNILTERELNQDKNNEWVIMEGPEFYKRMGGLKCKTC